MNAPTAAAVAIREELERMLSAAVFRRADRSSALLKFIVEETLQGRAERLKEYTLGTDALGRGESFDPRTDPVVRAEASRLRIRLEQYYQTAGQSDPLVIVLPKGAYVPQFLPREATDGTTTQVSAKRQLFEFARTPWLAWSCAVLASAAAIALWIGTRPFPGNAEPVLEFDVGLKADGVLASDVGTQVLLSRNGTRIVFVSRTPDGRTHLNTRRLDQPNAVRLPGTDDARSPFVSPDGQWIGFWANGKLKKISVNGGSPVILCDAADLLGASWGEDGAIIAALGAPGKLCRISASGGTPQIVIDLSADGTSPRWPQILPGSEFVLYTALSGAGADRGTIEVQSLRGGKRKVLIRGGTFGRYLANGWLGYINQGTFYVLGFDAATLSVKGTAVPVLEGVSYSGLFGYAQVDASDTGTLVYRKGAEGDLSVIDWIDRAGSKTPLLTTPGRYGWLRLSPDGRYLALTATESGASNILICDVKTGEMTPLTRESGDYTGLTWLPNSRTLLFGSQSGMGWINADQPGEATNLLTRVRTAQVPWSVAPNGGRLAYYERSPETGFDVWTAPVTRKNRVLDIGTPEPFLKSRAFEVYPSFSPDGQWITYASDESGAWEVYVRHFPDDGLKVRVSKSGGSVPRWSVNGKELLYRANAQCVMVVPYKTDKGSFIAGTPHPWTCDAFADTGVLPNFDTAHDGERILALVPANSPEPSDQDHVTVIINFFEKLQRRAAAR